MNFPLRATLFMLGAVFVFLFTCNDALDGLYARKTNQSSKRGELLDHWLDSMNGAILGFGMFIALDAPWWCLAGAAAVVHLPQYLQIIVYYKKKKYIHPPSGGMEAALTLMLGLICYALFFYITPLFVPEPYFSEYLFTFPIINLDLSLMTLATWGMSVIIIVGYLPAVLYPAKIAKKFTAYGIPTVLTSILISIALGISQVNNIWLTNQWFFIFINIGLGLRIVGSAVIQSTLQKGKITYIDYPSLLIIALLFLYYFINAQVSNIIPYIINTLLIVYLYGFGAFHFIIEFRACKH